MEAKSLTHLPRASQVIYGLKALLELVSNGRIGKFSGFTLLELFVVMGIISILSALAVPWYQTYIDTARVTKAITEIRLLDREILAYEIIKKRLPDTLGDIDIGNIEDPWGNPYQYLNFADAKGLGKMRKDRFVVPLNTDYDLYSMGKDGASKPPLTAASSRDDIIRANNGRYVGRASLY